MKHTCNLCLPVSLESDLVYGKLVSVSEEWTQERKKGVVVKKVGGIGMILVNTTANGDELVADNQ